MSYRRSYNTSISLSGSETVSYPASEHGGTTTAYWQHTEPISIDITVDTSPFDSSVQSCNGHVLALGAAVGVMNTAQCAAIQQGAKQVSASLQKGFFGTIKTELGAQMADLKNQFEAKLGLMVQQARSSKAGLERMPESCTVSGCLRRLRKICSSGARAPEPWSNMRTRGSWRTSRASCF